ncbi:predicted protein [Naegleria gruberi]|uniref:Predicted protein n=1 Tax=Naegleria gruberi TaxID=5762 RepID=D2VXU3_NAEGR|nr:uncharacterized protein NAEGRDRAFT_73875 [Naegleria gruberi]EFC38398.1 predicted protein [Naegleria gruberi]|eukprot:XP_002671142.1 predicted protein [Naegleria gruberi strain NEG-M]
MIPRDNINNQLQHNNSLFPISSNNNTNTFNANNTQSTTPNLNLQQQHLSISQQNTVTIPSHQFSQPTSHLAENYLHNTYSNVSFSTSLSASPNIHQQQIPTHNNLQYIQEKLLKELSPEQLFQLYMVLEKLPIPSSHHQQPSVQLNINNESTHVVVNPLKQTISIGHKSSIEDDFSHESVSQLLQNALHNQQQQHESSAGSNVLFSATHASTSLNLSNNLNALTSHQEAFPSMNQQHASNAIDLVSSHHVNQSSTVISKHQSRASSSSSKREEIPIPVLSGGVKKSSKHERHRPSPESALTCNFSMHTLESFKTEQLRIQSLPKRPRGRPRKPGSIPRGRKKPVPTTDEKKQQDDSTSSDNESASCSDASSEQSTNTAKPNH